MVTGRDVFNRALRLIGVTNTDGAVDRNRDGDLFKGALETVNQIYSDLFFIENPNGYFEPISSLEEDLLTYENGEQKLSRRCVNDVMPYGVAMLIAQNTGDNTMQAIMSITYTEKRASCVKRTRTITDTMPSGEW